VTAVTYSCGKRNSRFLCRGSEERVFAADRLVRRSIRQAER